MRHNKVVVLKENSNQCRLNIHITSSHDDDVGKNKWETRVSIHKWGQICKLWMLVNKII